MHNARLLMQVFQCNSNLCDDVARKVFTKVREANNLVEKLATRAELKNDIVVLSGFGEVDKLHDVGMIELAHDLDFLENICSLFEHDVSRCSSYAECDDEEGKECRTRL